MIPSFGFYKIWFQLKLFSSKVEGSFWAGQEVEDWMRGFLLEKFLSQTFYRKPQKVARSQDIWDISRLYQKIMFCIIFLWPWCMHIPTIITFIPFRFLKESEKMEKYFSIDQQPCAVSGLSEWLGRLRLIVALETLWMGSLGIVFHGDFDFFRHSNIYKGGRGECLTSKKRFWRQENWPNRRSNTKNKDKPGAENEKSWYKKNHYIFCFKIALIQYSAQKMLFVHVDILCVFNLKFIWAIKAITSPSSSSSSPPSVFVLYILRFDF